MTEKKSSVSVPLPAWLSPGVMLAAAIGILLLYYFSGFLPYLWLALLCGIFPAADLLLLLIFADKADTPPADVPMSVKGRLLKTLSAVAEFLRKISLPVAATLIALFVIGGGAIIFFTRNLKTSLYSLSYLHAVILIVVFVVFIILEKWCRHREDPDDNEKNSRFSCVMRNLRSFGGAARLGITLTAAAGVIKLLGFYDLQKFLLIALAVIYGYCGVFVLIDLTARLVRRELLTSPDLSVPLPFTSRDSRDIGIISYLEENTGITMRRLWSLKLIRTLIPYALLLTVLLIWISTGVVQIESDSRGALYRCGQLSDVPLEPGLHLTLPYPFDRVDVYNTEGVRKLTVGYRSEDNTDNTWTASHGTGEFRLLLGDGNEVVSINLRIEYKISDLIAFLRGSSAPEKLLEASAYRLITDRTIGTDLETLMSADREQFARDFRDRLAEMLADYETGIEIVSVVLESIHPPVEVAGVYQELISAGITAEKVILEAEGVAAVRRADAEIKRDREISAALSEQYDKTAAARADVEQFCAALAADRTAPGVYTYHKYLKSLTDAYGRARLIIVGNDVDSSRIYVGSLPQ